MKNIVAFALCAALAASASAQSLVDGSGTISSGGASQQVFAFNPTRRYLVCQNPIAASEPLFVNVGAAAGSANGSIELAPGGSWSMGPSTAWMPIAPVTVAAATAGHRFVCKQG